MMITGTSWIALRRPDTGWSGPLLASASEANPAAPRRAGVQGMEKRCHSCPRVDSSSAGRHASPSPQ